MPVFAIFFPVPVAVAATALVHGANNLAKAALFGGRANWHVVARFGLPAVLAALLGALVLGALSGSPPLARYTLAGHPASVTPLKLIIALLMVGFALFEVLPRLEALRFARRWLLLGGFLSGFFGGLSGHQGALRSAFLTKLGLDTEAFVACNAVSALLVDVTRLAVYGTLFLSGSGAGLIGQHGGWSLVGVGTAAAFAGTMVGKRLVRKVKMRWVERLTGVLLLIIAAGLISGLL
jgi:hypothetical protein